MDPAMNPSTSLTTKTTPVLPQELLRQILSFADNRTLSVCLRINNVMFDLAGETLYHDIDCDDYGWGINFLDVVAGVTRRKSNFKRRLLRQVRRLRLKSHPSCRSHPIRQACRHLTNLKSLRLAGCNHFNKICSLNNLRSREVCLNNFDPFNHLPYRKLLKNASAVRLVVNGRPTIFASWRYAEENELLGRFAQSQVLLWIIGRWWSELLFLVDGPLSGTAVDNLTTLTASKLEIYYLADPVAELPVWIRSLGVERFIPFSLDELNQSICETLKQRGILNIPSTPIRSRADYLRLGAGEFELGSRELQDLQESEARYVALRSGTSNS